MSQLTVEEDANAYVQYAKVRHQLIELRNKLRKSVFFVHVANDILSDAAGLKASKVTKTKVKKPDNVATKPSASATTDAKKAAEKKSKKSSD